MSITIYAVTETNRWDDVAPNDIRHFVDRGKAEEFATTLGEELAFDHRPMSETYEYSVTPITTDDGPICRRSCLTISANRSGGWVRREYVGSESIMTPETFVVEDFLMTSGARIFVSGTNHGLVRETFEALMEEFAVGINKSLAKIAGR